MLDASVMAYHVYIQTPASYTVVFHLRNLPAWKKIYKWNIQLFVVKKWEKYISPDRKMYIKYCIFLRICFVFIKKIYFNYTTFRQLYIKNICYTRREFFREILYNDMAIISIQHGKIYSVETFGDFSHTVEWNSLKFVWQISLYILA